MIRSRRGGHKQRAGGAIERAVGPIQEIALRQYGTPRAYQPRPPTSLKSVVPDMKRSL